MEEIAKVYARSLYEVASEQNNVELISEQLGAFADALSDNREMQVFFFSPYFSVQEKKEGLARAVQDADPTVENFLQALIERHRMPVLFRIRAGFDRLVDADNKLLPVLLTSAVELDEKLVASLGKKIGEQTGSDVQLTSKVDPEIIGGIVLRVGNFILDASIKTRLENLRREVASV